MKKRKAPGRALVVINESHHLLREQRALLKEKFAEWKNIRIPRRGLSVDGLRAMATFLQKTAVNNTHIVFASPVPYLIKKVSEYQGEYEVYIFVRGTRAASPERNGHYPWELIK